MSRTKKGSKGVGYEFWSKRPCSNKSGCLPGKFNKKRTHRVERQRAKKGTAA